MKLPTSLFLENTPILPRSDQNPYFSENLIFPKIEMSVDGHIWVPILKKLVWGLKHSQNSLQKNFSKNRPKNAKTPHGFVKIAVFWPFLEKKGVFWPNEVGNFKKNFFFTTGQHYISPKKNLMYTPIILQKLFEKTG